MIDKKNSMFISGVREGMSAALQIIKRRLEILHGDERSVYELSSLVDTLDDEITAIDIYLLEQENALD